MFPANLGLAYGFIAYLPQLTDDQEFITSIGVASWTKAWVTARVDLQDTNGNVVSPTNYQLLVPPYGHVQERIPIALKGGTAAVYIVSGPDDAMVYPYATVRSAITGDPTTIEAQISTVGLSAQAASMRANALRERPAALPVSRFSLQLLKQRTE